MSIIKVTALIVSIILLLVYLLFIKGKWPKYSEFNIDFDQVRELAKSSKEKLPEQINILTIATGELPSWAVSAGDFSKNNAKIVFPCFQLTYNNKTAIIEAPYNKRLFDKFSFGKEYYQDNYELMQKALLDADFIVPTHEHWDHLGGIAQSENIDKIIGKTLLTKEQINGPTIVDAEFPKGILENYKPVDYENYYCISPGVILIKSPGHSVGHQFVFVQLQNGNEFLFTGDVVWVGRNFKTHKSRPWIASKKRLENRHQISHQMRYLYDEFYMNKNQKIFLLSTHDPEQHEDYIKKELIYKGIYLN
jgi:glyoxylase-like metal-dependent hydrolase (beta-lactamase superfamily II)